MVHTDAYTYRSGRGNGDREEGTNSKDTSNRARQDHALERLPLEIDGEQCMAWAWKGEQGGEGLECGKPGVAELLS